MSQRDKVQRWWLSMESADSSDSLCAESLEYTVDREEPRPLTAELLSSPHLLPSPRSTPRRWSSLHFAKRNRTSLFEIRPSPSGSTIFRIRCTLSVVIDDLGTIRPSPHSQNPSTSSLIEPASIDSIDARKSVEAEPSSIDDQRPIDGIECSRRRDGEPPSIRNLFRFLKISGKEHRSTD